jgi:hypothetical protein
MPRVEYNRKYLTGAPLSIAGLRRLLSYDEGTEKVYWRRRKEEAVPSRRGTLRVRGHDLPLDYVKSALVTGEFPTFGEEGMLRWQDKLIATLRVRDTVILIGVYSNKGAVADARNEVFTFLMTEAYGPSAVLTGARRDNSTGFRGVSYLPNRKKYIGRVTTDGKTRSVGSFNTPEEAYEAVLREEARLKCS